MITNILEMLSKTALDYVSTFITDFLKTMSNEKKSETQANISHMRFL